MLRQAKPGTLGPLIERKPYLCLPVLRLVLPPVHAADPGDLLRIDFSRMGDAAEIADAIGQVLQAASRGKISPGEGARLVRRARKPLRKIRRALWHKKRMEGQIEPRRRSN